MWAIKKFLLSDIRIKKKVRDKFPYSIRQLVSYILWRRLPLNVPNLWLRTGIPESTAEAFHHRCNWADWEKDTDVLSSYTLCPSVLKVAREWQLKGKPGLEPEPGEG